MQKKWILITLCFFSLSWTSLTFADQNETADFALQTGFQSRFNLAETKNKIEKELLKQIEPEILSNITITDITLDKLSTTNQSTHALIDVIFEFTNQSPKKTVLSATYQNNEWEVQCNLIECSPYATPKTIVKQAIQSTIQKELQPFISTLFIKDPYIKKRVSSQLELMLPQLSTVMTKDNQIKTIGFYDVIYNDDFSQAIVPTQFLYQNGQEEKQIFKVIKYNDQWFIECEFSSCLIYNTPESVVEEFMTAFIVGDSEKLINSLSITNPTQKAILIQQTEHLLMQSKKNIQSRGGVKNIFVGEVTYLNSEKNRASIATQILFNNGAEERQNYQAIYGNGRWYIKFG